MALLGASLGGFGLSVPIAPNFVSGTGPMAQGSPTIDLRRGLESDSPMTWFLMVAPWLLAFLFAVMLLTRDRRRRPRPSKS